MDPKITFCAFAFSFADINILEYSWYVSSRVKKIFWETRFLS